jgi:hypothetical protein
MLLVEARGASHKPYDLDNPAHTIERPQVRLQLRQSVDGRKTGGLLALG